MKKRLFKTVCRAVPILLLPCLCLAEEYLLYEPKPATGAEKDKGVLVKSVTVQRGDTLKRIARRYIGKEWLFPQVLLFNKVGNPDLIHPGEKLYVPVSGQGEEGKAQVVKRKHARGKAKHRKAHRRRGAAAKVSVPQAPAEAVAPAQPAPRPAPAFERKKETSKAGRRSPKRAVSAAAPGDAQALYQSARKAYLQGNYRRAAALFSDFLKKNPDSAVAADASLYRADCYLQLSEQ